MESFRCYDNSDVIATLMMTNFHLYTTVVAIFPNVCLWRRSLCSELVLTLKNCIQPQFVCQDGPCCSNPMALISFRLFRKNLGKWFTTPPPPRSKKFPVCLCLLGDTKGNSYELMVNNLEMYRSQIVPPITPGA